MAYTSDKEIPDLNVAAALTGAELVPIAVIGEEATVTTTQEIADLAATNQMDSTVNFSVNADPNTGGTTFSPNTPNLTTVVYVSTINGSLWISDGTTYTTYVAPFWSKTGNTGTNTTTNFIGTTDNVNLRFRINNLQAGRLAVNGPTFFGYRAGELVSTDLINAVGFGALCLRQLTTGDSNVGVGASVLSAVTTSNGNTGIGNFALARTTGEYNLGIGAGAGQWNIAGSNQIFINSIPRDTYALERTESPIYVQQNVTVASQLITLNGRVGINTITPNASAALDITSTTQGLLLPRMTKVQRDAISSPVAGLAVYQTDNTPGLRVYNGTNWMRYTETAD